MSGHSKWSTIKHRKGAADKAKSNIWGKLAKRIIVESKLANGDVTSPTLRTMIEKARKENMPKENIERAVKKALPLSGSEIRAGILAEDRNLAQDIQLAYERGTRAKERAAEEQRRLAYDIGV